MAHSITALMRCRTFRAVWTFTCQIGVRTSSTSALAISETDRLPMRGKAWRSRLFSQVRAWMGLRQPARLPSTARAAASAKVGMASARRLSASGSPPSRASLRFDSARSRASASDTKAVLPSPSSRFRPRMTIRWTQLRVPVGWTTR